MFALILSGPQLNYPSDLNRLFLLRKFPVQLNFTTPPPTQHHTTFLYKLLPFSPTECYMELNILLTPCRALVSAKLNSVISLISVTTSMLFLLLDLCSPTTIMPPSPSPILNFCFTFLCSSTNSHVQYDAQCQH